MSNLLAAQSQLIETTAVPPTLDSVSRSPYFEDIVNTIGARETGMHVMAVLTRRDGGYGLDVTDLNTLRIAVRLAADSPELPQFTDDTRMQEYIDGVRGYREMILRAAEVRKGNV